MTNETIMQKFSRVVRSMVDRVRKAVNRWVRMFKDLIAYRKAQRRVAKIDKTLTYTKKTVRRKKLLNERAQLEGIIFLIGSTYGWQAYHLRPLETDRFRSKGVAVNGTR